MAKQAKVNLTNGEVYLSAAIGVVFTILIYTALTHFIPDVRAQDAYKLFSALGGTAAFCILTVLFRHLNH